MNTFELIYTYKPPKQIYREISLKVFYIRNTGRSRYVRIKCAHLNQDPDKTVINKLMAQKINFKPQVIKKMD